MSRLAWLRLRHPRCPWTPWSGGACPVPTDARITILRRDGRTERGPAGAWSWWQDHSPDGFEEPDEIVGYRMRTA